MVRSVTTFDEDFTEEDMQAALVWHAEQAARCSGCGLPFDETTAADAEGTYDVELVRCHACAAAESAEHHWREGGGDTAGLKRRIREGAPSVEG